MRTCLVASCAAVSYLAPPVAWAQDTSRDPALAEALFREGKELMDAGRFGEACPKLKESQRLDPAIGTLLRLARCHESEGKTASAWTEYAEGLALARKDGRQDRIQFAQEGLDRVEPLLSRLKIVVPKPAADIEGLIVELDGVEIRRPAWDTPAPVDPGSHTLKVSAPGYREVKLQVRIEGASASKEIVIPVPEKVPEETAGTKPMSTVSTSEPNRVPAYVAGGVGIVAVGVGSYFGLRAMSKRNDAVAVCPTARCSISSAVDDNDDAKRSAWISNIAFGLGVAALGVGTYLYLSPSDSGREQGAAPLGPHVALVPSLGDRSGGFALEGTW